MKRASEYLSLTGPFCEQIDGYQVRDNQLALCDAIDNAIEAGNVLAAEAGTGIGKTFAYLVPALLSGKKVIISTGTRHLQDQLFHTDLPRVTKALSVQSSSALLKGRSNYLCLHRLKLAPHLGFINRETRSILTEVDEWSKSTKSGDISELSSVAEDSYVWPMVTSTADNCLGSECDSWEKCFIVNARKAAQAADVVVINHHLLLADMTLKNEGFVELLPEAEAFIIDEAHQLYDVAARFFGDTVSSRQLISLARDTVAEQVNDASDMVELRDYAEELEKAARDFRISLGESGLRDAWLKIQKKPSVKQALDELETALKDLITILEQAAERSRGLEQCCERAQIIMARLKLFQKEYSTDDATQSVLWYETYTKSFMLHVTPIDVASIFQAHTNNFSNSWLFTSATLQVNKQFSHFANNIGLENFESGVWDSPFDYEKQSLLYLPENLPQPSDPDYTKQLMQSAIPVLTASQGRAFVLFTSYYAMYKARDYLKQMLPYELLVQGDLPKHQLLETFRQTKNAILLGTSSFWEGVDVRGESLSCVIIDKLPFASPGDPVMQARIDAIKQQGGQPFMEFQVPQAVITLKQGVGRLIRDVKDTGVVMIGDPRLKQKAYGRIFLNSLPAMPVTSDVKDVEQFFNPVQSADDANSGIAETV
ncbi:DinG family ATP-dependent helicase YoaA [hydrothermal vent metagenome]|uniref:DinG family ATP-dependent helicase YoaA n=1 Tax=hydrothermal vent metagenome TaxID=652676 RepID=A0A3B0WG58_9ZZZZ